MRWPFRRGRRGSAVPLAPRAHQWVPPPRPAVATVPPAVATTPPADPPVRLLFRDGTELTFDAGSPWARAFEAVADALCSRTRRCGR